MAYEPDTDEEDDKTISGQEQAVADAKDSKPWLDMIEEAEKAFKTWQDRADGIDKLYADLEKLAAVGRDRQFQMFWANIQVLGPSIYARPPIPVVVPRFKDRKALPRITSELLERCTTVGFECEDIDQIMRMVRDDLTIVARGAIWVRYEAKGDTGALYENVCIEHADRKDFLHQPARKWKEVDWVAKRSWLTKKQAKKRFSGPSGEAYLDAAYEVRKDETNHDDGEKKAGIWEIWCKSENKVCWVTEGVEVVLDESAPHLTLEGFFPCPRPAYSTVQRRTLVPVPDMIFYKDQLEEINELTARIGALSEAVKVRGFYPAGAGEIGDAVEAALKVKSDNQVLVPIANWALVGQSGVKDMIVWLPTEMIVTTITELVNLRKQLIEDVYEITGLSDIMRGSTEASETATAQNLKSQYGSIRIRDRQDELVRIARDTACIVAEIMAENFSLKTLLAMSQMDIPSDADIAKQIEPIEGQTKQILGTVEKAKADPQIMQQAQQNPQAAQQKLDEAKQQVQGLQQQIAKIKQTPTVEQIINLLRDQKLRPFILDIETDSTIAPDENAQKQRVTEFITAVGGFMQQAMPEVQAMPEAAPVVAEMLKFISSQFRVGREMEGVIDEFADKMAQQAGQAKGPTPEQQKAQADAEAMQQQNQLAAQKQQTDMQIATAKLQFEQQKHQNEQDTAMVKAQGDAEQRSLAWRMAELSSLTSLEVARIGAKVDTDSNNISTQLEALLGFAKMGHEKDMQAAEQAHEQGLAQQAQAAAADQTASNQDHEQTMAAQAQEAEPAEAGA